MSWRAAHSPGWRKGRCGGRGCSVWWRSLHHLHCSSANHQHRRSCVVHGRQWARVQETFCPRSSSSCWVKEAWAWWKRGQSWSPMATTTITPRTLRLPPHQPVRKSCPLSQTRPCPALLPPRLRSRLPLTAHLPLPLLSPLLRPLCPRAWARGRKGVPLPHLSQGRRAERSGSRRTRGRCRSWPTRMRGLKQRLSDLVRRFSGHAAPSSKGSSTPGNEGLREGSGVGREKRLERRNKKNYGNHEMHL